MFSYTCIPRAKPRTVGIEFDYPLFYQTERTQAWIPPASENRDSLACVGRMHGVDFHLWCGKAKYDKDAFGHRTSLKYWVLLDKEMLQFSTRQKHHDLYHGEHYVLHPNKTLLVVKSKVKWKYRRVEKNHYRIRQEEVLVKNLTSQWDTSKCKKKNSCNENKTHSRNYIRSKFVYPFKRVWV